jgi:polysaccharide biosynthesis/export protein
MEDTELNVGVRGNDRIYVESDERYFLSLGATGTQAQHFFPQDRVTAIDALAIIGGLSESSADAKGILILRAYEAGDIRSDGTGPRHERTIFTIDLTSADGLFSAGEFRVQPGDLIYVTESPLIGTRNFLGLVAAIFGIGVQAGNVLD